MMNPWCFREARIEVFRSDVSNKSLQQEAPLSALNHIWGSNFKGQQGRVVQSLIKVIP